MTVTELAAMAFAVLLAGAVGWRAADDAAHPKTVLVRAEWTCRRSHAEVEARSIAAPNGAAAHELVPVMICDDWSRR